MLRGFHLTRDLDTPVAGVNLGRVGFLTTILSERLEDGLEELLAGAYTEHPLLGLRARLGPSVFRATNDVVIGKGDRSHASSLALRINGVTLFEVLCDGVVVGTPAGSSAYSLAAGGPLLGISVEAYVISLVAPHAVGVRPVVAAPGRRAGSNQHRGRRRLLHRYRRPAGRQSSRRAQCSRSRRSPPWLRSLCLRETACITISETVCSRQGEQCSRPSPSATSCSSRMPRLSSARGSPL